MDNLPPDIKLTDYIPAWDEISQKDLLDARSRIVSYLKTGMPDLDTSPNTLIGAQVLDPLSHLLMAFEIAANRMFSDLDMANVAAGTIYNCAFVKRYIENFGVLDRLQQPASGIVQLVFTSARRYVIPSSSAFVFGELLFTLQDTTKDIIIDTESVAALSNDIKGLKQVGENKYVIYLSLVGPAGALIKEGATASSSISIPELESITAFTDFDSGVTTTSVSEQAALVPQTFYSASLNTRSGVVSFLLTNFPELIGASATISGDREMLRDKTNILGIAEGKVDVFVKYRKSYTTAVKKLTLVYNNNTGNYQGALLLGTDVPVYIDRVVRYRTNNEIRIVDVYGMSTNTSRFPDLSATYSDQEKLDIEVYDSNPVLGTEAYTSNITSNSEEYRVIIEGQFNGDPYSGATSRAVTLRLNSAGLYEGSQRLFGVLQDTTTYETCPVVMTQKENTKYLTNIETPEYNRFLNGITIFVERIGADRFDIGQFATKDLTFGFSVYGRTALFEIQYRFDPFLQSVRSLIQHPETTPCNTDVLVRNFYTCYVDNITINYRVRYGQHIDTEQIKKEVFNYVNSITYPNTYEIGTIMEIVYFYGAEGVQSVTQYGRFLKTVATKYSIDDEYTPVEQIFTSTLLPSNNIAGMGHRNINYILDVKNITFNAIVV